MSCLNGGKFNFHAKVKDIDSLVQECPSWESRKKGKKFLMIYFLFHDPFHLVWVASSSSLLRNRLCLNANNSKCVVFLSNIECADKFTA